MLEKIKNDGLIVILRGVPTESLIDVAESIYRGGGRIFEVALSDEVAYEQINILKENFKGREVVIGAGTVTNLEKAKKAHEVKSDFFLTPGLSLEVLDYASNNNIPIIPGVFSPSEFQFCIERNMRLLKLFPVDNVKMNYLKSLRGPYSDFEVFAVGGISEDNAEDYLKSGYIGLGMGSSLIKKDEIIERNFEAMESRVKLLKLKIKNYKE